MPTLLRIDASVRTEGSYSRAVADQLRDGWVRANPGGRVVVRDLAEAPPPHLCARTMAALLGAPGATDATSDELIGELAAATDLLISTPLYNFGIPSTLKAWFDHVVRAGHTFELRDGAYWPLLTGGTAYVVAARGGMARPAIDDDFVLPYLSAILPFIGWPRIELVPVSGMAFPSAMRDAQLAAAKTAVDRLFP